MLLGSPSRPTLLAGLGAGSASVPGPGHGCSTRAGAARRAWLVAAALLVVPAASARPAAEPARPEPEALLRDADRARGGTLNGITWNVELVTTEEGRTEQLSFLVRARLNDALAEILTPPRRKGEVMLFNDRTIWFVKPGLRKPVSISPRQRLSGEAANGDIATTNYARDYEGTIVGEDVVDGVPAWRLELKARAKSVTYDRIRYWIGKERRLGIKAEFLTVGGDLFKTATFEYGNRLRSGGVAFDFVSTMTIRDATGAGATTVLRFGTPREENHPASLFNINNVLR